MFRKIYYNKKVNSIVKPVRTNPKPVFWGNSSRLSDLKNSFLVTQKHFFFFFLFKARAGFFRPLNCFLSSINRLLLITKPFYPKPGLGESKNRIWFLIRNGCKLCSVFLLLSMDRFYTRTRPRLHGKSWNGN